MKVLVTGASGLLGRGLMKELRESWDGEVVGVGLARLRGGLERLDLRDFIAVDRYVAKKRPDVVVHAAGERQRGEGRRHIERLRLMNVDVTAHLSAAARSAGAFLLYVSTNHVFDGRSPPYSPGATTNPLDSYGRSKRDGELAVLNSGVDACILRLPLLYGHVEQLDECSVTAIAKRIVGESRIELDHRSVRYPTSVADVAVTTRRLLEVWERQAELAPIVHFTAHEGFTKFEMAVIIAEQLGVGVDRLVPLNCTARGSDTTIFTDYYMDCTGLRLLGVTVTCRAFADGIKPILDEHLRGEQVLMTGSEDVSH